MRNLVIEKPKKVEVQSEDLASVSHGANSEIINEEEIRDVEDGLPQHIPEGMPRTNRLDKMTREQAVWAIKNGDAWIAYLKKYGGEIL